MKFLFIILFAVTISGIIALIGADEKNRNSPRYLFGVMCCGLAAVAGIADLFGAMRSTPFRYSFLMMGAVSAFEFFMYSRRNKGEPDINKKISKITLAAFILELTLFQLPSLPTAFVGKYKPTALDLTQAEITGGAFDKFNEDGGAECKGNESVTFCYENIGIPVGSIRAEADFGKGTHFIDSWTDMTDETVSGLRDNASSGRIADGADYTQYMSCSFSGNVDKLNIEFKCPEWENSYTIKKITLNAPIPFEVSFLRIFLIVGFISLGIYLAEAKEMQKPVEKQKRSFRFWITETAIAAMTLALIAAMVKAPDGGIKGFFMADCGDQMTQQLVDSFENGRLYIDEEVPQWLLDMDNPYHWDARRDMEYEWDHLLYKGKYYSYYGIAPVVLLYMPFHLITGSYFTQNAAVLLFTLIGLLFLSKAYYCFIRRFFSKIPTGCAVSGHIIMMISCGIWYSVNQPQFYQAAISAGFAATAAGAYFLLSSGIFGKEKISLPRTALSSLFFGLAVMSRPTLAVYAMSAYVLYALNIRQAAYITDKKTDKKRSILYALCGALPLAALGVCQMAYNYARFGSPFDFGIQYSLTINDFTHSEFHLNFVLLGLFYYLFTPPMLKSDYPYITNDFSQFDIHGYYYRCPETAAGLIFLALPCIGYIYTKKALGLLNNTKSKLTAGIAVGIPLVVMPLVIICSVWESGYAVRYFADFSWELLLGALTILFFLYIKEGNGTLKRQYRTFMGAAVVIAALINIPMIYGVMFPKDEFPAICAAFSRVFAFWK